MNEKKKKNAIFEDLRPSTPPTIRNNAKQRNYICIAIKEANECTRYGHTDIRELNIPIEDGKKN